MLFRYSALVSRQNLLIYAEIIGLIGALIVIVGVIIYS